MVKQQIAAAAAAILVAMPCAAFDNPTQQPTGLTFFVAIPLDARVVKDNSLYTGMFVQGKRDYESFRVDSRMFNDKRTFNFFGTGIEAKWLIAGAVAAGAVVAVASKDKSTSSSYQQQQQQQQEQQQQQQNNSTGGGGGGSTPCPVTPSCP